MKEKEITLDEIKSSLRESMNEKYGGVTKFLKSKDGQKFGGMKIKPYLYSGGATSFEPLRDLAKFFGLGTLTRRLVITKKTTYYVSR
jgi:hypothetical protein